MNTMVLMNILTVIKKINPIKSMITNLTFKALFAHWDKGRTKFSGEDSGIKDFDLTTDFLIIFSRTSFAATVHTSVVVSTTTIL